MAPRSLQSPTRDVRPTQEATTPPRSLESPTRDVLPTPEELPTRDVLPTPECSLPPMCPNGQIALQSLSKAAKDMLKMDPAANRHGKSGPRSIAMSKRIADSNFQEHGRPPVYTPLEGHAYRLIFGLVLDEIEDRGLHDRMHPIPKAAKDVARFHSTHGVHFHNNCVIPWRQMTNDQKIERLKAFMHMKFSISRPTPRNDQGVMPPPVMKYRRSDVGWNSFWMTEAEINAIADAAFSTYLIESPYFDLPSNHWDGCPDSHKT